MIPGDAAAQSPDLLPLVTALAGALAAGLLALLGVWVQSAREHTRWLREQRYEAYARVQKYAWKLLDAQVDIEDVTARVAGLTEASSSAPRQAALDALEKLGIKVRQLHDELSDALVPLEMLGPDRVANLGRVMMTENDSIEALEKNIRVFNHEARKALGVKV